uniref:DUF1768 domain-containing protein n=1 Tax=Heterorhabditis bacteriophora TaxID=37862 RepID=A0A1I7XT95_HETBA
MTIEPSKVNPTLEPVTSTESLDSLDMIERHFEPAFDQLGSSRLQNILEIDLPRPKALLSHHGYDVGQGAIAGAVAVVVVVCVGFLLVLLVIGVLKMRDTPIPKRKKTKKQLHQVEVIEYLLYDMNSGFRGGIGWKDNIYNSLSASYSFGLQESHISSGYSSEYNSTSWLGSLQTPSQQINYSYSPGYTQHPVYTYQVNNDQPNCTYPSSKVTYDQDLYPYQYQQSSQVFPNLPVCSGVSFRHVSRSKKRKEGTVPKITRTFGIKPVSASIKNVSTRKTVPTVKNSDLSITNSVLPSPTPLVSNTKLKIDIIGDKNLSQNMDQNQGEFPPNHQRIVSNSGWWSGGEQGNIPYNMGYRDTYSRGRGGGWSGRRLRSNNNQNDIPFVPLPEDQPSISLTIDPDNVIGFHGFNSIFTTQHHLYYGLQFPLLIDGKIYESGDHYYQIQKVQDLCGTVSDKLIETGNSVRDDRGRRLDGKIGFRSHDDKSFSQLAKEIIRLNNIDKKVVDEWRYGKGLEATQKALLAKVSQSTHFREALRNSSAKILVHAYAGDSIYGSGCTVSQIRKWCEDMKASGATMLKIPALFPLTTESISMCPNVAQGRNVLGVILMQLRCVGIILWLTSSVISVSRELLIAGKISVLDMSSVFNALHDDITEGIDDQVNLLFFNNYVVLFLVTLYRKIYSITVF